MKLVTIKTFVYPHEAAITTHLLESEGIEYFITDDVSIQINPLWSNGLGGVKLQVWEKDVKRTLLLLKVNIDDVDINEPSPPILNPSTKKKHNSNWALYKWVIIILTAIFAVAYLIFIIITPSLEETLIENDWCVNHVIIDTFNIIPYTQERRIELDLPGECIEDIDFHSTGRFTFPGFSSPEFYGDWSLSNNRLTLVADKKRFRRINGTYNCILNGNSLILQSDSVVISTVKKKEWQPPF